MNDWVLVAKNENDSAYKATYEQDLISSTAGAYAWIKLLEATYQSIFASPRLEARVVTPPTLTTSKIDFN